MKPSKRARDGFRRGREGRWLGGRMKKGAQHSMVLNGSCETR